MSNCASSQMRSPLPHQPLHSCDGIGPVGPRGLDQLFEGRILSVFQRSDLDVARSLADALEQVVWVIELSAEKEPESHALL